MLKEDIQYKQFVWELSNLIKDENDINRNIIFLCIGTSRVVGDSVGPIVGSILKQNIISNKQIEVLGDCENNIHYENIEQNVDIVKKLNPNSLIVVIDSALSKEENIGRIFVQNRGLKYGEGIKKKSNIVGNISIKAVVGKNFKDEFKNFCVLKRTSSSRVSILANTISSGILQIVN